MRLLIVATIALLLSGCTDPPAPDGDSVVIRDGDVFPNDHTIDHISCGDMARLSVESAVGEGGDFSVQLRGGAGYTVFSGTYAASTATTLEEDVTGGAGLWEVRVDRSLEYDGTFTVKLTCL